MTIQELERVDTSKLAISIESTTPKVKGYILGFIAGVQASSNEEKQDKCQSTDSKE